jgi:hypothetical protein
MRIFLAGASGAIGRRLTPLLIAAGHEVTGTTRSVKKVLTAEGRPRGEGDRSRPGPSVPWGHPGGRWGGTPLAIISKGAQTGESLCAPFPLLPAPPGSYSDDEIAASLGRGTVSGRNLCH